MQQGTLRTNNEGRYELIDEQERVITYFTCGELIDIYDEYSHSWLQGRVEYDDNYSGYYFFNPNGHHRVFLMV